jgi:predicted RND superfamily exporter protein
MDRVLRAIAAFATQRPRAVLAGAAVLALAAALFAARAARIETDLMRFLPDAPAVRAFAEARTLAREPGTLYALFTIDDAAPPAAGEPGARLLAYARAFAQALRESGRVASVEFEVPPVYEAFVRTILARAGFLYLEGADLDEALAKLNDAAIDAEIDAAAARVRSAAPAELARLVAGDPLGLIRIFSRRLSGAAGAFANLDAASGALLTKDRHALLAKIVGRGAPGDMAYARALMDALTAAEARARVEVPGVAAGYTGGYVFAAEDERSIRRDVIVTVGSSTATVLGIFILAFRRGRAFLYASAPLAVGIALGLAAFVALRREVTVAAAAFVSVVVGLAVDFPIHLLARYLGARRAGSGIAEANEAAVASAGRGALAAGLMTGAAFFSLGATGFRGLADLGVMAGACLLGCMAATLVLFPALTAAYGAREEARGVSGFGLAAVWRAVLARPGAIVAGAAAASVAAIIVLAVRGPAVSLETNIRNLRPRSARALDVQDEIARRMGGSLEVALALVHAPDEEAALAALARARAGLERLRAAGAIAGFDSPERWLPARERQEAALARLAAIDPARVERTLRAAIARAGFRAAAFEGAIATLRAQLRPAIVTRATLEAAGLGALAEGIVVRERAAALVTVFPRLDAPREGVGHALAAALAPAAEAPADVEVTGIGAVIGALVSRLERDFALATGASIALVFVIALAHFRRARDALLATAPVGLGLLWMLGAMKVAGLSLNFMNVIVFPMVIGIEDNSLHVLHRLRERGGAGLEAVLGEVGLALFLCTATTMLGFGSLVLSENRGLASIGALTLLAKTTCWVSSTVVLPAWLAWRGAARAAAE